MGSKIFGMLDGYIGPPIGVLLLGLALVLMLQGHRRIKLITVLSGAGIGNYVSGLVHPYVDSFVTLSQDEFQTAVTVLCALLLFLVVNLASIFITAAISLYAMLTLVEFLESRGYDVGGELEGGIVTIIAILLNRLLRKNLFIIGSAAIGSILGVVGYLLMTGTLPSDMDVTSYPFNMIIFALFLNSLMIQKQDQKKQRERKELEKFMQEAEREPIKFMEDDILTSAYQEEREYRSMEAYQTPRYY